MKSILAPVGRDARGAVFVEKLIVYLPLLLTFFLAWELAELGAASIVVQRASAAAGRAAIVVLSDDPVYYDGEPVGSYGGRRREDIELSAGMVLSAIPHFREDFQVDVSDPDGDFGAMDVTVSALYRCSTVGLLCGGDDALELVSSTSHVYQGARYEYSTPSGAELGAGSAALVDGSGRQRRRSIDGNGDDEVELGTQSQAVTGNGTPAPFTGCGKGNGAAAYGGQNQNPGVHLGTQLGTSYASSGSSLEALKYRCARKAAGNDVGMRNVAVVTYSCDGGPSRTLVDASVTGGAHSEPNVYKKYLDATEGEQNCTISEFYTEREPCDDGANCSKWFTRHADPSTRQNITYHFGYNPKRSVDTTRDEYYKPGKRACTNFKRQYKTWVKNNPDPCGRNSNPDRCSEIERWAQANGKSNDANLKKCLEFLQAKEDFSDDGPRKAYEKETKATVTAAEKQCPHIDYSDYVEDVEMEDA